MRCTLRAVRGFAQFSRISRGGNREKITISKGTKSPCPQLLELERFRNRFVRFARVVRRFSAAFAAPRKAPLKAARGHDQRPKQFLLLPQCGPEGPHYRACGYTNLGIALVTCHLDVTTEDLLTSEADKLPGFGAQVIGNRHPQREIAEQLDLDRLRCLAQTDIRNVGKHMD